MSLKVLHFRSEQFQLLLDLLQQRQYTMALGKAKTLLEGDCTNLYLRAFTRHLQKFLEDGVEDGRHLPPSSHTHILTLQQICKMALQRHSICVKSSIRDMREHLRAKALSEKSNEWLAQARHRFSLQQYQEAREEAERALLLFPNNHEAQAFVNSLPPLPENDSPKPATQVTDATRHTSDDDFLSDVSLPPVRSHIDKALACLSYAQYYRSINDFETARRYINEGLHYDPENKVLQQLGREFEEFSEGLQKAEKG